VKKLELYQVDDKEFENHYCIKTTDVELAKKLLTDKHISSMLNIAMSIFLEMRYSFNL